MLNPSKANEVEGDQTVKRCISFAKEWGYGLLKVVNLFSLIETDSKKLKDINRHELVDEKTNKFIQDCINDSDKIIVAWGDDGVKIWPERIKDVMSWITNKPVYCLSKNNSGQPLHPSRAKTIEERELILWYP
jgi:hypothetical protein